MRVVHYASTMPTPEDSTKMAGKRVIDLGELVRMKLNSYRRKDQVHLIDMIKVGLIVENLKNADPEAAKKIEAELQKIIDAAIPAEQ